MTMKTGGSPGRFSRDLLIVAGHELTDSIRSRRAMLIAILFGACAAIATSGFVSVLKSAEQQLVASLGLDAGISGGSATVLWKSEFFRSMIIGLVGDKNLAESLLQFTPIGLYFGWLSMTFVPWLVAFMSSARVTEEIWSGSARFVLCRTTRLAWLTGKYLGQALLLLAGLFFCLLASWLTGYLGLESFDGQTTLADMIIFMPKAWIYGVAFLGLVTGISVYCRSPVIAHVLGILAIMGVTATYHIAGHFAGDGWRRVLDVVQIALPRNYYFDLMRTDIAHALPAAVFLAALGFTYMLLGYLRLARRDL